MSLDATGNNGDIQMPIAKSFKFNFKSRAIKDEATGNVLGRTKKQPSVECEVPVLAADEIMAILQQGDSKEAGLIQEAVARLIIDAARDQFDEVIESFGEDSTKEVSASMLDYSKLSLEYIASIPASQSASTALTEEDWTVFFDDYLAVMVVATGKAEDKIKNHINLFKKPAKAKSNKPVLEVLVDQLDIYMASSANLEETGTCAARISEKFKRWIDEPEKAVNLDLL
jgi:hypothetical protein